MYKTTEMSTPLADSSRNHKKTNFVDRFCRFVMLLAALFLAFACSGSGKASSGAGSQTADKPNPVLSSVTLACGSATISVEVARTEEQRTRGLMFRKSLTDGKGMLFVFDADLRPAFWMKNTGIPLSLAYITSDGMIAQILDLVPFSTEARPSERFIRYALETPQGWYSKNGLKVGDRFVIPPID